ncbi:hypothetical protein CLV91_1679 [Maribacter vaceletii]|uniref:Uncharacterized protein n=1 Tax=Maribacter vaceletii TaxID=1206816 RepID=A0A495EAS2_9FLAO|nr:hypothetical protein [Maribacter vaceletii]RKR12967.1 hypothetical protein CLV91_1679 [Maribacter vaceletii]
MFKKRKRKAIKTQAVFVKNNQVFFKTSSTNKNYSEEWLPVALQWTTV